MPSFNHEHLKILNLDDSQLENLEDNERIHLIDKHWRRLSGEYHPDRQHGKSEDQKKEAAKKIRLINHAHDELKKSSESYQTYSNNDFSFLKQESIEIPETAFDLLIQESIEEVYNNLKSDYSALETEHAKQNFCMHYAPFINLAQAMERKKDQFYSARATYLYAQENAPLINLITLEWRQLIIRLFAEEYLDDFQYRHALATGKLSAILAMRKLLSPIKILAAIINSMILVVCKPIVHYYNIFLTQFITKFMGVYNANDFNPLNISILAIGFIAIAGLPIVLLYLSPTLTLALMSLPAVASVIEFLACPVNQFIRPLAVFSKLPAVILTSLSAVFGAAAIYRLVSLGLLTSLITILPYLSVALSLYSLVRFVQLMIKLYEREPSVVIIIGILIGIMEVMERMILPSSIRLEGPLDTVLFFIMNCSLAFASYYANKLFDHTNIEMAKKIEILPLPAEDIPDEIKKATLLGHKKALQSHRFFNTSEHAEFLTNQERTIWQQTASFFGNNMKKQEDTRPTFGKAPMPLAICCAF